MSDPFLILDYEKVIEKITRFISGQVRSRKKNGVVVGLSGGIDSSVCVVLASRAIENNKIIGLIMPERGLTPVTDIQNAPR
jgi:NAD+ synthase